MAHGEVFVLLVVLSCVILLQQIVMATMADYRCLYHQRQLILTQLAGTTHRRRPRRERAQRRFWIRPGQTSLWWDNFLNGTTLDEEWKENFRMSHEIFSNWLTCCVHISNKM